MAEHDDEDKVVAVEFKISMHCNACERKVAKAVSKIEGVEKFMTDMKNHRVIITGRFDPDKAKKKLKKKTGKKVEIIRNEEEKKEDPIVGNDQTVDFHPPPIFPGLSTCDEWLESSVITMFNDENVEACSIM